ncbi:hypothetical protein OMR07_12540 [Methylobacterium organophilum]|nr:hypothetical protein [Methylobacterium organophilum]
MIEAAISSLAAATVCTLLEVCSEVAATRTDWSVVRAALDAALRESPDLARTWRARPDLAAAFAALDRAVFGAAGAPVPDLRALSLTLSRAEPGEAAAPAPERLAPLDGPVR